MCLIVHPRGAGCWLDAPASDASVATNHRRSQPRLMITDARPFAVDHSIVMYLMSPEGEFLEFFTQLMTATEIADKVEKVMKQRAKQR